MKKMKKIGLLLVVSLFIALMPFDSYAEYRATDGDWSVNNGTLTISGNGKMRFLFNTNGSSQQYSCIAPWESYKNKVTSVVIEEGISSIGKFAFAGFTNLETVSIPNTVTEIESNAFSKCNNLKSIKLPSSLETLNSSAFDYCSSLKNIEIPASVKSIDNTISFFGRSIFANCSSMTDINVAEANENYCSIDGVLYTKDKKTLLKYPDGKQGESYKIPNGITEIGSQSLLYTKYLTKVFIPQSVKKIDCYALTESSIRPNESITDIYYEGSEEDWNTLPDVSLWNITVHYNAIVTNPPKISGMPVVNGNKLNINLSDVEYNSSLITVFSNDKAMVSANEIPLSAGDTSKSITIPAAAKTAKVFIWDSLNGMKPLCEAKTLSINK